MLVAVVGPVEFPHQRGEFYIAFRLALKSVPLSFPIERQPRMLGQNASKLFKIALLDG